MKVYPHEASVVRVWIQKTQTLTTPSVLKAESEEGKEKRAQ